MAIHIYSAFVLACTLSTHAGGNDRTLPVQEARITFNKKLPGIH
jgi:hypothetical protein